MSHRKTRVAGALTASFLLAATLEPAAGPHDPPPAACAAAAASEPLPHCCFTNPRYVGTCEIAPTKDESCASILQYLNNPQSQGKGYCGGTSVRGGWKQVPCEPKMKQD
ncbi:MAG TPA: hypothetical protein VMT70_18340 [Vicinamibacteria bacterium]|nr:hypothetical protein [Vicinamibacteria bacterium]